VEAEELLRESEDPNRAADMTNRRLSAQRNTDSTRAAVADNSRWLTAQRDSASQRAAGLNKKLGLSAERNPPAAVPKDVSKPAVVKPADPKTITRLITKVFEQRDAESLKHLALALIAHPNVIAILASRDKEAARLVFARSADAPGDMNALMREACALLEGRGGGKADLAQGGGKNVSRLDEALAAAVSGIKRD
jgi:alanyl-tRNA synthetase